ncbi:ribonuclease H [Malassezia cuniculi]|uniref:Ribonuclease n=1 Tax=Malassezia cuniculi TaxID=948313 RepID=A0AAF0ETK9_9BASI|nr:ribonuclease H [Malassezia cuniculi]
MAQVPSVRDEPLTSSYTWHSAVPEACVSECKTGSGRVPCVLGVDEAGRGPVLGPLVYGVAYCPRDSMDVLKSIGFADSKALTAEKRNILLAALIENHAQMGWAVRVMSPQDISAGMLRKRPHNLNAQSSDATVSLIQGVLDAGVDVTEIYVDTVGDPGTYSRLLQSYFPKHGHIKWTVTRKADAIYPIVGAASIAAKVTRDACIEGWKYIEQVDDKLTDEDGELATGSGYPGDPRTVRYLHETLDPVFGWAGIVRFSWATAKSLFEEPAPKNQDARTRFGTQRPSKTLGYSVRWMDEPVTLTSFFKSTAKKGSRQLATLAAPKPTTCESALNKQKGALWRDLNLSSVGDEGLL